MKWQTGVKWALAILALLMVKAVIQPSVPGQNATMDLTRAILKSQGYSKWETYVLDGVSFKSPVRLVYDEKKSQALSKSSTEPVVIRVFEAEETFGETSMQLIHVTFTKEAIPNLNTHLRESAERYFLGAGDTDRKYTIVPLELPPFRAGRLSYLMKHTKTPMYSESIHLVKGKDYWVFHFLRPTDISALAENFIKDVYFIGTNK